MKKPLTLKKLCFYSQKRNLSEGKNLFLKDSLVLRRLWPLKIQAFDKGVILILT